MRKIREQSEKKASFYYHRLFLKMSLKLSKYSIIVALGLATIYLFLSIFRPSTENKAALPAFVFLPFIWFFQFLILREFKKNKTHIKTLRKILIPYLLIFLVYTAVLCYLAFTNNPYVANLNAQICILISLFFHVLLIFTMLYSLWVRYNRLSIVLVSLIENFALIAIPILQIVILGINLYVFVVSGLLCFNPYYFYYGITFFLWLPITSFSFVFLFCSQIRAGIQVYPEWKDAFPCLCDQEK